MSQDFNAGAWQFDPAMRGDRFWILSRGVWYRSAAYKRLSKRLELAVETNLRDAVARAESGSETSLVKTGEKQFTLPAVI